MGGGGRKKSPEFEKKTRNELIHFSDNFDPFQISLLSLLVIHVSEICSFFDLDTLCCKLEHQNSFIKAVKITSDQREEETEKRREFGERNFFAFLS